MWAARRQVGYGLWNSMCKMRFREVNLDSRPDARTGRSPGCFIQRFRQRVPADGEANVGPPARKDAYQPDP